MAYGNETYIMTKGGKQQQTVSRNEILHKTKQCSLRDRIMNEELGWELNKEGRHQNAAEGTIER